MCYSQSLLTRTIFNAKFTYKYGIIILLQICISLVLLSLIIDIGPVLQY